MELHICSTTVEKPEELEQYEMHEDEIRVTALQGFACRELTQLSLTTGWHVLPNGVAAYSDPVALHFLDPRGNFDVE